MFFHCSPVSRKYRPRESELGLEGESLRDTCSRGPMGIAGERAVVVRTSIACNAARDQELSITLAWLWMC